MITDQETLVAVLKKLNQNQTDLLNQTQGANSSFAFVLKDGQSYHLTQAKLEEYCAAYPLLDVKCELEKASQWLTDNPAKRKTENGMPRFLSGWIGRAKPSKDKFRQFAQADENAFFDRYVEENAPTEEEAKALLQEVGK